MGERGDHVGKKQWQLGLAHLAAALRGDPNTVSAVQMRKLRPKTTYLGIKVDLTPKAGSSPRALGRISADRHSLSPASAKERFPRWPQGWATKALSSLPTSH